MDTAQRTMLLVTLTASMAAELGADQAGAIGDLEALHAPAIPVLGVASIFHAGYLLRCVRSIDHPVETLVVVHNGVDEGVAAAIETLQRERPQMRVVRVPENSG